MYLLLISDNIFFLWKIQLFIVYLCIVSLYQLIQFEKKYKIMQNVCDAVFFLLFLNI